MKVLRLLIYEGSIEEVEKQLANSLPDGKRTGLGHLTITAITLGTLPFVNLDILWEEKEETHGKT